MVYLYSVKNVINLGKLIGLLLLLFRLPLLLSILFLKLQPLNVHTKNTRNVLARPVMGTIFLVYKWLQSSQVKSGSFTVNCC